MFLGPNWLKKLTIRVKYFRFTIKTTLLNLVLQQDHQFCHRVLFLQFKKKNFHKIERIELILIAKIYPCYTVFVLFSNLLRQIL